MKKPVKNDHSTKGIFDAVHLDERFPITVPGWNIRGDVAPIPPHTHDCFEIGYCYEGTGVFTVENKILPFKGGDMVVVNHRELHLMVSAFGKTSRWRFCNLDPVRLLAGHVPAGEPHLEADSFCGSGFTNVFDSDRHPELCAVVRDIVTEMAEQPRGYRSLVRSLVWNLMVRLHRAFPPGSGGEGASRELSRLHLARVRPAIEHIASHYDRPVMDADLARLCRMSRPHFRRIFKEAAGLAPHEYLISFRMNVAAALLKNTDRKILDIAFSAGCPTLSNFNRHFRAVFKQTPRQFRCSRNT
ncbi:MAG: AraC family transcriptional regulator [Verrucomicrobiae bacterium]|nr:AraC family transcriptional regulator [Verrucomicrobiae bacterium]